MRKVLRPKAAEGAPLTRQVVSKGCVRFAQRGQFQKV